mmetsp:Transcript_10194/g.16623  ORF Transcript_10194/g.16623 Transcript_10194/m.16623 type:complete len:177 (+) Transcript_10194:154-684(+)
MTGRSPISALTAKPPGSSPAAPCGTFRRTGAIHDLNCHVFAPVMLEIKPALPNIDDKALKTGLWGSISEALMAQFETIRTGAGARTAQIDAGLRAHMNKVYGTMSVGMLLTFAAAWAVGTNAALFETLFTGITRWIVMFAPLIMVFAFSAMINKLSAAAAQLFFYTFAAVMGVSIS